MDTRGIIIIVSYPTSRIHILNHHHGVMVGELPYLQHLASNILPAGTAHHTKRAVVARLTVGLVGTTENR